MLKMLKRRGRGPFSLTVGAATVITAALLAPVATADQPVRVPFTQTSTGVVTDLCAFPITQEMTVTATEVIFTGTARVSAHFVEQDVFSANGKSLTSSPYTFNVQATIDSNGNFTMEEVSGVVVKVPLPDGGLFISSGRYVRENPTGAPVFFPDNGGTHNLAGFCAALAP
jgi:hypothetical protein